MFAGHYAVSFAAKRLAPKTSLGLLVFAGQFLDLLWPILVLLSIEHVRVAPGITRMTPLDFYDYPISHSLLAVVGWGALLGCIYAIATRRIRAAVVLGVLVVSHWVLDYLTHRPDLPLAPGSESRVGLGLWNFVAAAVALELALFAAGVALYVRTTRARDRIGSIGFWSLVLCILAIYTASIFGPPPETAMQVAGAGMAAWLFPLWAWWVDRHRETTLIA